MRDCLFVISPAAESLEVRADYAEVEVRGTYTARMRRLTRTQKYRQFDLVSEEVMGRRIEGFRTELRDFLADKKEVVDLIVDEASQAGGSRATSRCHLGDLYARLMDTSDSTPEVSSVPGRGAQGFAPPSRKRARPQGGRSAGDRLLKCVRARSWSRRTKKRYGAGASGSVRTRWT